MSFLDPGVVYDLMPYIISTHTTSCAT